MMKRRAFLQSLVALATVPAVPGGVRLAAAGTAGVPELARFWAGAMAKMGAQCTPLMLQTALNISKADAASHVAVLTREGVIPHRTQRGQTFRPRPRMQRAARRMGIVLDNHARMVDPPVGFA